jgi:S-adenosylmethionine synthetase
LHASAQLALQPGVALKDVQPQIEAIFDTRLSHIYDFTQELCDGKISVW